MRRRRGREEERERRREEEEEEEEREEEEEERKREGNEISTCAHFDVCVYKQHRALPSSPQTDAETFFWTSTSTLLQGEQEEEVAEGTGK
jgi:hypothetical protein